MVLFIVGLVLSVASLGFLVFKCIKFSKHHEVKNNECKIDKNFFILLCVLTFAAGAFTVTSSLGLTLWMKWVLNPFEIFLCSLGSLLLGSGAAVTLASFILHYYVPELEKKQKLITKILMISCAVVTVIGLWVFSESIAHQDIYPLINRLDFVTGLVSPKGPKSQYGVQFYGIIIVSGAFVCYAITDHRVYQKYGAHGLIDTLFIVSFLFGVIGARLWSCLILDFWKYADNPITIITNIQDGGLAIHGGIYVGITAGVIFVLLFRKYMNPRYVMDVAIPTILLAQAIGRWGNFFNQEVYGFETTSWALNLLPTMVRENMYINGHYVVPLFLIESLVNICGFVIIRVVIGRVFKLKEGLGIQSGAYLIWYGLVRIIMEPLRNSQFEYDVSVTSAIGMTIVGALLIIAMVILHLVRKSKGLEDSEGNRIKTSV